MGHALRMYSGIMASQRAQIVIGLILSLGAGLMPLGTWGRATGLLGLLASGEIFWWAAVTVLILYVLLIERRPLPLWGSAPSGSCREP